MQASLNALAKARAICRITGSEIYPAGLPLEQAPNGAVLLVDATPTGEELAAYAAELPRLTAVVMWCEGWSDAGQAATQLASVGVEHGSVDIIMGERPGALCALTHSEQSAARLAAGLLDTPSPMHFLAILPAFNEEDVIFHAIGSLISEGIDVYLLDHLSTDGTVAAATPWLGRGLVRIESFPDESGFAERNRTAMVWRDILRRAEEITSEVTADWYMFTNADEFRESPWPRMTLADGFRTVDQLGYNAINFEVFDFRPVDDGLIPGEDPRQSLLYFQPPGAYDRLQIKAWKRQATSVDIVSTGGHDAIFEGKRVFPIPFILRHYPIRSSEHGRRKVLHERLPRFAPEEREMRWHVQYDHYAGGSDFLHDPETLRRWDADAARSEILGASAIEVLTAMTLSGLTTNALGVQAEGMSHWLARRGTPLRDGHELQAAQQRLAAAGSGVPAGSERINAIAKNLGLALEINARVRGDIAGATTIGGLRTALSAEPDRSDVEAAVH